MKKTLICISLFFLLSGCSNLPWFDSAEEKKSNATTQLRINEAELDEASKQLTTAIVEAQEGEENKNNRDILILELSLLDQQIEGLPIEKLNVDDILKTVSENKAAFDKQIEEARQSLILMQKENVGLRLEVENLNNKLESEKNKSVFDRLSGWFLGLSIPTLIIGILLIVFFPAIGIPMFTAIINWLVSMIPQLIGFFGVVSKKLVDSIIQSVQILRTELKNDPDGLIKKSDVIKMIDGNLSSKMNKSDKRIVLERKARLGLK